MTTNTEEKELVWLPKKLALQLKDVESSPDGLILQYIEESKREIQASISALDEDVLMFKGMLAKVRIEFGKAKDEHIKTAYEIWESYEKDVPKISEKVAAAVKELTPLKNELNEITAIMKNLNDYRVKDLVEMLATLRDCLGGQNGDMLKFLMENFQIKKD